MTGSSSEKIKSARLFAYEALFQIFEKDGYTNLIIQNILRKFSLKKEERHLLTELVYGVCRNYNYLLWVIGQLSSRPIKKIDPAVRILLSLGLYQLIYLDRIPESAAVNETVKISKKVTHLGNSKFINGILRNYIRNKDNFILPQKEENLSLYYSLVYNVPEWLANRWIREWGEKKTEEVLIAFQKTPLLCIRINTLKTTTDEIEKIFMAKGISFRRVPYLKDALIVREGADLIFNDLLKEGSIYIQNPSSMAAAVILGAQENEKILDMCAAPGSKTTYIASMMNNKGAIDAWDLYPHKIQLIEENAKRLGIFIIHGEARDATQPFSALYGTYDRVLLDAPCSGLGVIGHKPEIRWKRRESDLSEFPAIQQKLLEEASHYLKAGGILVYSTCTLNREENENIVEAFLASHSDFESTNFEIDTLGESKNGMMTLWPDDQERDGFFIAKLRRTHDET